MGVHESVFPNVVFQVSVGVPVKKAEGPPDPLQ